MEQCDVLVVGGGNAGCAAALAAARSGSKVLLAERYGFLGGTATASMVGPWMTFHSGRDRIVGGIAQEMVERLVALGASPGHVADSSDYVDSITPFDPEVHKALLFEMMREAGVRLLLHVYFLEAVRDEHGRVRGARFATVGGVREILAGRTIDATADAFVANSAGVRMQETALRGNVQPATMMFRLSHVDMEELSTYVRRHPEEMRTSLKTHERTPERMTAIAGLYRLWQEALERGEVTVKRELVSLFATPYPDELTVNMSRVVDIDPLDPDDLTRAEVESRAQVMELLRFFRARVPGFKNARLAATATQSGSANRAASSASTRLRRATCSKRGAFRMQSHAVLTRSTFTIPKARERRPSVCRKAARTRFRTAVSSRSTSTISSSRDAASRRRTKRTRRRV